MHYFKDEEKNKKVVEGKRSFNNITSQEFNCSFLSKIIKDKDVE
jgi:hypothetical protein